MVSLVGGGADLVAFEVLGGGAASHRTPSALSVGDDHSQSVGQGVEVGGESAVAGQSHRAGIVAVAVLPLHEVVTFIGGGADFVAEEMLGCGIAAAHTAHRNIGALHVQSIGIGVEHCLNTLYQQVASDSGRCLISISCIGREVTLAQRPFAEVVARGGFCQNPHTIALGHIGERSAVDGDV